MMTAAGHAVEQQAAYSQAFKDVAAHVEVDDAWARVKGQVETHLRLLQKRAQVRVRNWLKKLSEETANVVWKKNRNAYARLLLEQLRRGTLVEPFSVQPPDGPLPTLPKHMAYAFLPHRSVSPGAKARANPAPQQAQPQAHWPELAPQQPQAPPNQSLSATEQLNAYLGRGRAEFRRAQQVEDQAALTPHAEGQTNTNGGADSEAQYLPGTRMQLRGAEGRRVDRHQLNDVTWQPSKLELEAQLGASRERQLELQWRLQHVEGLLRQQQAAQPPPQPQLQSAAAAPAPAGGALAPPPLGSLLDVLERTGGVVPSPRQFRRRGGTIELEALIGRHEAKRLQRRQSPQHAAKPQPVLSPGDEEAVLQQLGNFQRQTEALRRAMGGGNGGEAGTGSPSHLPQPASLPAPAGNWSCGAEGGALIQQLARQATPWEGRSPWAPGGGSGGAGPHQQPFALFDGLPLTPAAFKFWQADRNALHAGQPERGSLSTPPPQQTQQAAQQQAAQQQGPAPSPRPAVAGVGKAAGGAAAEHRLPRSPIGPDTRHTKKSAAAAAGRARASAAAALQRLKSARQSPALAASPASVTVQLSPAAQQAQVQEAGQQAVPQHHNQQQQQQQQQPAQQHIQQQQDARAEQQTQTDATPLQEAPAQPPCLPSDSNAALVSEVRDLRSRLLASLQKHAPEGSHLAGSPRIGIGSCSRSGVSTAAPFQLHKRLDVEGEVSSMGAGSWRLAAVHAAGHSAPAAAVTPVAFSWAGPAASVAVSSSKYRVSDLGSSSSSAGAGEFGLLSPAVSTLGGGGGGTPTSLSSGMASLAQLSSLDLGSSLSPVPPKPFSIESFRQQTEALRRQLAAGV